MGELLAQTGAGNFTQGSSLGYLGGVLDAATGLIYVGNGHYYDPATGRFLSRGVNPGAVNPYVPWQGNPAGMIIAPLALLALLRGKLKSGKMDQLLALLIVVTAVGLTLTGCNPPPPPQPPTGEPTNPPTNTKEPTKPIDDKGDKHITVTPPPTKTPAPSWLCMLRVDSELQSNWGFGVNENKFNDWIIQVSNQYHIPTWIMKGLIARESSFDPTAKSGSGAWGLGQTTGYGIDARWREGNSVAGEDVNEINREIKRAYKLAKSTGAIFTIDSTDLESDQTWYNSLQPSEKTTLLGFAFSSINGQCDPADEYSGGCNNDAELLMSLHYLASDLMIARNEMRWAVNEREGRENAWDQLSLEDQWKLSLANYNSGVGGGSDGFISRAVGYSAVPISWNTVVDAIHKHLEKECGDAPDYAEDIINKYAKRGGG